MPVESGAKRGTAAATAKNRSCSRTSAISPADAPHTAQRRSLGERVTHGHSEKNTATANNDGAWLMPGAMYM